MEDVVVIGGGLAGLTTAYRLLVAGKRVRCLEANAVAGGCVQTEHAQGYRCERGAQNFLEERDGSVQRLARELGIADRIRPAKQTGQYLAWDDGVWSVPKQLPRLLSFKGLCRAALETCVGRGPRGEEESVAAWARRRFGDEVAQRLIDPMISGIYAGDPERLSAQAAFALGVELEHKQRSVILGAFKSKPARRGVLSFANGMGSLPAALADALGSALHPATEAVRIAPEDHGYRIETRDATKRNSAGVLRATRVVIATPAPAAAQLAAGVDAVLAGLLGSIPYSPLVSAWLAFRSRDFISPVPKGYGVIRPHCQGGRMLGCMFCSSMFDDAAPPEQILLRVLFGGRRDAAACALSQTEIAGLAQRELAPMLGIKPGAEPIFVHVDRQRLPQYELGHAQRLDAIEERLRRFPGLHVVGSAYRGVPVSKVVEQASRLARDLLRSAAPARA
jgi:oxygen-dependent protoporphyrinogen oxidase